MNNVVHLTTVHRPFDTRIFHKECRTLAAVGYQVSLVVPHSTRETVEGVELVPIPHVSDRLARGARVTRGILGAYRTARRLQADVYHFHDPELLPIGLLLKLTTQAAVIYDVHENYPENMRAKEWLPSWGRVLASWAVDRIEHTVAAHVDGVVSATERIARRFPSSRTRVIRNYPRLSILNQLSTHQQARDSNYGLIYTGGLTDYRGAYQIVQAMDILKNPYSRLVLLGGHVHHQTQARVHASPGWSRVDYRGQVSYEEMIEHLRSAAIGLVCNQPVYGYDHALPNKLFEYMAAGLAVIASDFDLWREIVEENGCGLTVDPTSPREIASAVDYLLERPKLRCSMGENGRRAIRQKYNWARESHRLLQLYREVLHQC